MRRRRRAARRRADGARCRPTRTLGTTSAQSASCRPTSIRSTNQLDDPMERARLARVFERGLGKPVGYVLPVQRWNARRPARGAGSASRWSRAPSKLFLVPGDSPIGLPACRWRRCRTSPPLDYPVRRAAPIRSPSRGELPRAASVGASRSAAARRREPRRRRRADVSASRRRGAVVRTALCVEPRDGRLYVFMPPVETLEDYLDLVAAIEDDGRRARAAGHARRLQPPHDPRLNVIKVTPDPGVIEVNVQPAATWDEMRRDHRRPLRGRAPDAARRPRSSCSTAATPAPAAATTSCSAAPRRRQPVPAPARPAAQPDHLLAEPSVAVVSVLRPVHRPDEPGAARRRGAPRLALRARDRVRADRRARTARRAAVAGRPAVPQPAGRRHRQHAPRRDLHRQALLARRPDRPARPGRVPRLRDAAARADEPGPAAAAARADRALLARAVPRHAGALGHAAARPLHAAALRLARFPRRARRHERERGLPARARVVRAAFRVPLSALRRASSYGGIELELRQALEPWHVLGEEGAAAAPCATSIRRSSGCRSGHGPDRRPLRRRAATAGACRCIRPARTASTSAGVRYRAWQPASCLHPTIPVARAADLRSVRPLDRAARSAAAPITWRIPAAATSRRFPVNSYEAESRRLARFFPFGHTPGPIPCRALAPSPEFPLHARSALVALQLESRSDGKPTARTMSRRWT